MLKYCFVFLPPLIKFWRKHEILPVEPLFGPLWAILVCRYNGDWSECMVGCMCIWWLLVTCGNVIAPREVITSIVSVRVILLGGVMGGAVKYTPYAFFCRRVRQRYSKYTFVNSLGDFVEFPIFGK